MRDLQITVKVSARANQEARAFLRFLRTAAKKHSFVISVLADGPGEFKCSVPRKDVEKFGLFLQELMLNHGLYYYLCSVSHRREVARVVVKPIFQEFLDTCFPITYPSLLRRHVLEGSLDWLMAGDFTDPFAQEYEILLHRLKLKMISGYEFIRNLDDMLTELMLLQLGYGKGKRSPNFNVLVDECGKRDILRYQEFRDAFKTVHSLRTRGLHRLERSIPDSQLSQIALQVYYSFQYLNDYHEAQQEKTVMLKGKRYRRVRYGNEFRQWKPITRDEKSQLEEIAGRPCHDCGVIRGEIHLDGCDWERCPRCGGQYIGCECHSDDDDETTLTQTFDDVPAAK